jgi:hypothetical protein
MLRCAVLWLLQGLVLDVKGILGARTDVPALLAQMITPPEPAALLQGARVWLCNAVLLYCCFVLLRYTFNSSWMAISKLPLVHICQLTAMSVPHTFLLSSSPFAPPPARPPQPSPLCA